MFYICLNSGMAPLFYNIIMFSKSPHSHRNSPCPFSIHSQHPLEKCSVGRPNDIILHRIALWDVVSGRVYRGSIMWKDYQTIFAVFHDSLHGLTFIVCPHQPFLARIDNFMIFRQPSCLTAAILLLTNCDEVVVGHYFSEKSCFPIPKKGFPIWRPPSSSSGQDYIFKIAQIW